MQGEQEISISLEQLYKIDKNKQQPLRLNSFAVYLSANSVKVQMDLPEQFIAKDTNRIPLIPIRRTGCLKCMIENKQCQDCEECTKNGKICCRDLNCIYDFKDYVKFNEAEIYQKCSCMTNYQPSSIEFEIDWRLLELLNKLNKSQFTKYNYYLHYKAGILSISERTLAKEEEEGKIKRLIFQNSFSSNPDFQMGIQLVDQNMRNLRGLFKQNIKSYISYWQSWDQSNIYESCHEIIEKCLSNKYLDQFRQQMQNQSKTNENEFYSGRSLNLSQKMINITNSSVKISDQTFSDLSKAINKNIIFFYHSQLNQLVVSNATYEEKETNNGIRIYQIMQQNESESLKKAIWFKDRKGDIFAICNQQISIFKYHLSLKKMKQIVLRKDKNLNRITRVQQILYIPRNDRVYYFNSTNLGLSFYFQLYRPYTNEQKEFSNCLSINPLNPLSSKRWLKLEIPFYRSAFIMEESIVQSDEERIKQFLPIIYLFGYVSKNITSPFNVYRLTFIKNEIFLEECNSVIKNLQLKARSLNYQNGIFTMVKIDKNPTFCFQSQVNGTQILITGKLLLNQANMRIQWSMTPLLIENDGYYGNQKKKFLLQFQKQEFGKVPYFLLTNCNNVNHYDKQNPVKDILINDIIGVKTNNVSKYLGFLSNQNRFVEIIFGVYEGDYEWHVLNCI